MHKNRKYIIRRVAGLLLTGLYVVVAMLNTSVVQSYIGAAVGKYFSKEWGGKVRIGSMHVSPFSHVVLNQIELISPTNDTIYYGDRISCRFKHFPYHGDRLSMDRVYLRNGRYHFLSYSDGKGHRGTNLDFITDYFSHGPSTSTGPSRFVVEVGELRLRNIDYIQDLPEPHGHQTPPGVDIPHMHFLGTSAYMRNVRVVNDSVACRIVSLSTTEASGLQVVDLSMDVDVSPQGIKASNMDLQTGDSRLFLDATLDYDGWDEMQDYCNTVRHNVVLKDGTEVNLRDAAYWAPELWGIDATVVVKGHVYGPVADMTAENFSVSFGEGSHIDLDAHIAGLPDIRNTRFDVDIHNLRTHYDDLAAVRHPAPITMKAPDIIRQLGLIDMAASMHGNANKFEAAFDLDSYIGDLSGRIDVQYDSARQDYVYVGDLDSRAMGIRALLPNDWVSRTGFHFALQGVGFTPETMEASIDGRLYNTQFKGHEFARAVVSVEMANMAVDADIELDDPMIGLDVSARAELSKPMRLDGAVRMDHAHLSALHLLETDSALTLSTRLNTHLTGNTWDELTGSLLMENTRCTLGSRETAMDRLSVNVDDHGGRKQLALRSDWADADIHGYFRYTDLPLLARDFCSRYFPMYYNPFRNARTTDLTPLYTDDFTIDLTWNADPEASIYNLAPAVRIAEGASLTGSYNYGDALKLVLRADSVALGGVVLHNVGLNGGVQGESYQLRLRSSAINMGGMELMDNVQMTADAGNAISMLNINWDDNQADFRNEGNLEFYLNSSPDDNRLMVTKPSFYVMGERWNLSCPGGIFFNRERQQVDDLKVYGLGQSIGVKAMLAGKKDDFVRATFSDYAVGSLASLLLADKNMHLDGRLDGTLQLLGFSETPYLNADMVVEDCLLNDQPLGRVDIKSAYETDKQLVFLDLSTHRSVEGRSAEPVALHGTLALASATKKMDVDVRLDDVALQTMQPLVGNAVSRMEGSADGQLHLGGTPNSPRIDGTLTVDNSLLQVAATGVSYRCHDQLNIVNNTLSLDGFTILDPQGNKARVDGTVSLTNNGVMLDLSLLTDRIMVLNRPSSESDFYGTLMASAQGTLVGPADQLDINVDAAALAGSELYVPISNRKEVSENEYIVFAQPAVMRRTNNAIRREQRSFAPSSRTNMQVNINVTPGMKLHLPMDFQQISANVTAVGRGDIQVAIRNGGQPSVLGNYEFSSGNFSMSLLSLVSRTFAIEEGSTLNFPGTIGDARFNINAVYNLRANLATLVGAGSSSSISDSYVPVQDVIMLSGTLADPTVKFDIRLPNAEQSVTDQVFAYIDKNNERDMLNQSISLLVMGRFANNGMAGTEGSEGINGLGLLTSSVSGIVSSLVKVVDVNLNYQTGTTSSTGQFDVGISKQWNKLYFESTFGYGNLNNELDVDLNNVLVGDVELGYKLTPFFRFYGFNRSNTSYFTRTELPYKQGVGVKLTKDFDTFSDLFPWLRKRKERDTNSNNLPQ